METEIFTLCDNAQDYMGKLVIVGTFDTINSKVFPCIHPNCSIAARLRFAENEMGQHTFKITLINNKRQNIIPPLEGKVQVNKSKTDYTTVNFAFTLNQLKFEDQGRYSFELYIDDEWKSGLPLALVKI